MSDIENAFTQATDNLIALYRSIERSTLDLPLVSFMPGLIFFWSLLKFEFFFFVGIFLIIPTNLVILVRNFFPGHWRYRPFFLRHLYYVWLWIWRGEAPTAPLIFIRPLLNIFLKGHFEHRIRRLRLEIVLRDGLSDATRSALLARLDAALERWKLPRFKAVFLTFLLPGIISFPGWYKQLSDFLGSVGIHMPTDVVVNFVSNMSPDGLLLFAVNGLGYLLAIPITNLLAKRGLFLGREPNGICFPGGQGGHGAYLKENEILGNVGLHSHETPIDLWLLGIGGMLSWLFVLLDWDYYIAVIRSSSNLGPEFESQFESVSSTYYGIFIASAVVFLILLAVAALRRRRNGRA